MEGCVALLIPLAPVIDPPVIETPGAPEFFINGTVTVREPDVVHIICYVERKTGELVERIEVCRCHIGQSNYTTNLTRAFLKLRGDSH